MFKGKIQQFVLSLVALLLICSSSVASAAAVSPVVAYGLDTVAGHETLVRSSELAASESISFVLKNPSGETFEVEAQTNANGVAMAKLGEEYTSVAGSYAVAIERGGAYSNYSTFRVFPGLLSLSESRFTPENQVLNGDEKFVRLSVKLVDDYGNPIEGHLVRLFSSETADVIESINEISDDNGLVNFRVSPSERGAHTFTAYDVTTDEVLDNKAKLAYTPGQDIASYLKLNTFGDLGYYGSSGNSSGPVDGFLFEDVTDPINPGATVSLTVRAVDVSKQTVVDYTGTLRFSVNGDNSDFVTLPEDYSFTLEDQGEHTYSLALGFQQLGTYELQVTDTDNIDIFGTEDIEVVLAEDSLSNAPAGSGIKINSPLPGTYSNSIQVVSGVTSPGTKLKVFDNDLELASIVSDFTGSFSYTTTSLLDGSHKLYVAEVNDVGTIVKTSANVNFNIDTQAPEISNVLIEPAELAQGGTGTIKVLVNDEMSSVSAVINGNLVELAEAGEGVYQSVFAAPPLAGNYPVEIVLVDLLGNESRLKNQAAVMVAKKPVEVVKLPPDVTGLKARAENERVVLLWDAVVTSDIPIDHFRIFYGNSPNELTEAIDTFTNALGWYVPNLRNGSDFYFAVVAIAANNESSAHFSNIVKAVPLPPVLVVNGPPLEVESPEVVNGVAGSEALEDMEKDVSNSGPEILWLFLVAAIAGFFYVRIRPIQGR
jgi:hypothetical protein